MAETFDAAPYTFDLTPQGWSVQGQNAFGVTIAPDDGSVSDHPDDFEGKLVIMFDANPPGGRAVDLDGRRFWITGDSGYTTISTRTVAGEPAGAVRIQYPNNTAWDQDAMLAFTASVHVGDDARTGQGSPTYADPMEVLTRAEWGARASAHEARVDAFVAPHLARRAESVKHPVHDFLFTYYSQRPAQLRRWHPGYDVRLADALEYDGLKGYDDGAVSAAYVASQRPLVESIHALLSATAGRPAHFGCFGLHEWAMVYRLADDETRHADWPLRLGGAGTDAVVESHKVACSHFDAFRFFTEPARPLNTLSPGRDDRAAFEQPACLHAGMDLYKHAFRLTPMVSSDLVADCFELARDIRELDMRAAPYDLTDLGFEPVRIETPEGKTAYVEAQREFARRGAPLRACIVEACERLLGVLANQ